MKRPTHAQIETAVAWLMANEGTEGGEREACRAVADWLEAEAEARVVRTCARRAGVPVAKVRERLKLNKEKNR